MRNIPPVQTLSFSWFLRNWGSVSNGASWFGLINGFGNSPDLFLLIFNHLHGYPNNITSQVLASKSFRMIEINIFQMKYLRGIVNELLSGRLNAETGVLVFKHLANLVCGGRIRVGTRWVTYIDDDPDLFLPYVSPEFFNHLFSLLLHLRQLVEDPGNLIWRCPTKLRWFFGFLIGMLRRGRMLVDVLKSLELSLAGTLSKGVGVCQTYSGWERQGIVCWLL